MQPVINQINQFVKIGLLWADGVNIHRDHNELESRLSALLHTRMQPLTDSEDNFRKACRDMLRNGTYKPTGRSKPASEYLLREALDAKFPRINTLVDINNYISLKYSVPISMWDRQKIHSDSYLFRLGTELESFIFNVTGQTIQLRDLVSGFAVRGGIEVPIVTPVKDSQLTKTDDNTRQIGVAVYYPAYWAGEPGLEKICNEFADLLLMVTESVQVEII